MSMVDKPYKPGRSKLTIDLARQIRAERATGKTHQQLSQQFQISSSVISNICNGKAWKERPDAG